MKQKLILLMICLLSLFSITGCFPSKEQLQTELEKQYTEKVKPQIDEKTKEYKEIADKKIEETKKQYEEKVKKQVEDVEKTMKKELYKQVEDVEKTVEKELYKQMEEIKGVNTHNLNEKIIIGNSETDDHIWFIFKSVKTMDNIDGSKPSEGKTFIFIEYEVGNSSKKSSSYRPDSFMLIDEGGLEYPTTAKDITILFDSEKVDFKGELPPDLSGETGVVFEIPEKINPVYLKIPGDISLFDIFIRLK